MEEPLVSSGSTRGGSCRGGRDGWGALINVHGLDGRPGGQVIKSVWIGLTLTGQDRGVPEGDPPTPFVGQGVRHRTGTAGSLTVLHLFIDELDKVIGEANGNLDRHTATIPQWDSNRDQRRSQTAPSGVSRTSMPAATSASRT